MIRLKKISTNLEVDDLQKSKEEIIKDKKRSAERRLIKSMIDKNNSEIHILNRFLSDEKDKLSKLINDTKKLEFKMMATRR